jgi:hypothetical protein
MTRKRNDNHGTEFGLWLRNQKPIDSKKGFVTSDLDYIWNNYKSDLWMLIEEKRYNSKMTYSQKQLFSILDGIAKNDNKYKGFHLIVFEKTNPVDGKIKLDGKNINTLDLINFLKFKQSNKWYKTYYPIRKEAKKYA